VSGRALSKPWIPLTADAVAALPAQLGVYELGADDGTVVRIAYAGGRELFGLRSVLAAELEARVGAGEPPGRFRYELTHGYLTRWEELLMVHQARHGELPPGNADRLHPVGRLTL